MSDFEEKKKSEISPNHLSETNSRPEMGNGSKAFDEQRAANRLDQGRREGDASAGTREFARENKQEPSAHNERRAADRLTGEASAKPTECQPIKDQARLGDLENRNLEIAYDQKQLQKESAGLNDEKARLERERKYIADNPVAAQEKPPAQYRMAEDRSTRSQEIADQARLAEIRNGISQVEAKQREVQGKLEALRMEQQKNNAERRQIERRAGLN